MSSVDLPVRKRIAFAVGNIGGLAIGQSSILLLYTYYFLYVGVPLPPLGISAILAVFAIWDALNEPLVGHFSDFTNTRWGRRKPYIIAGLAPLVLTAYLIYTPPVDSPVSAAIYLVIVLLAYDLCVTFVISMWYSLFAELSLDQDVRLGISKYLQIFGVIGLVLGMGAAPMIAGAFPTPAEGYPIMGLIMGVICVVVMLPTIFSIKERPEYQVRADAKVGFFQSVKLAFKSRSFVLFTLVQFLLQLAYSLVISSLPLFFEGVLGLGSLEYSVLLLGTFATVLPGLFFWVKLAQKRGTKRALFWSMLCFCAAFPFAFFMTSPGIALVVLLAGGIGLGGLMLFPTMLLGDVIDEDQVQSGKRQEGLFTGVSGVIVKMSNAISWVLIGVVLTVFQVDRDNLTPATITPLNTIGLQVLVGALPVLVILLGVWCLHKYPLTGKRLDEVKVQVQSLNASLQAVKPGGSQNPAQ